MPTQNQTAALAATAAAFGLPVTAALPAPKPAKGKGKVATAKATKRAAKPARPAKWQPAPTATIVLASTTNPYRKGTKAAATYAMFAKAGTVAKAQALAAKAGGAGAKGKYDIGYLWYASRDKHISFAAAQ